MIIHISSTFAAILGTCPACKCAVENYATAQIQVESCELFEKELDFYPLAEFRLHSATAPA